MSNYTKATNFATKDTLPTGDSNKIVKGTEIDNEFNAISGAISSKADIASPTFTGTPAAPTATAGSNTTQLANTSFVTAAITDTVTATTTFTNKTINLTSNTLVGTLAQFNTAVSDADLATIAGTETLTNKTLTSPTINSATLSSPTLTGTPVAPTAAAATNTTQVATTAHVFAERTNTATLTNKTLTSPTINSATISGGSISGITDLAVADGGTGASTLAANAVLLGNGTSALQTVAPSTSGNVLTSNGTTWTSATPTVVRGLGINGEVWNDVTGSRSFNSQYTNSRSYPIAISARTTCSGSSAISFIVDGLTISNFSWQFNGCGSFGGGFVIVPPGKTYQLNSGQGLDFWRELY
jgi:hypothetical protein